MNARRLLLVLLVALVPLRASAQLDDLLSPLAPEEKESAKKKKKVTPKKKKRVSRDRDDKKDDDKDDGANDLLAPLVPAKGEVLVKVSGPADGAIVTINGREVKAGTKVEVDAGEHTVAVKRPGFSDYSKKVKVAAGQTLEVAASLDATAGVLTVNADVPGSTVLLDGKPLGEVPVRGVLVSPGSHEVVVRREGFEDHTARIAVRAGRDYTVSGTLKPKEQTRTLVASSADRPERTNLVPDEGARGDDIGLGTSTTTSKVEPWYQRWYVWAGVGAVAVAAATSAVVVSNNNNRGLTAAEVCDLDPNDGQPGVCDDTINAPAALMRLGMGLGARF